LTNLAHNSFFTGIIIQSFLFRQQENYLFGSPFLYAGYFIYCEKEKDTGGYSRLVVVSYYTRCGFSSYAACVTNRNRFTNVSADYAYALILLCNLFLIKTVREKFLARNWRSFNISNEFELLNLRIVCTHYPTESSVQWQYGYKIR